RASLAVVGLGGAVLRRGETSLRKGAGAEEVAAAVAGLLDGEEVSDAVAALPGLVDGDVVALSSELRSAERDFGADLRNATGRRGRRMVARRRRRLGEPAVPARGARAHRGRGPRRAAAARQFDRAGPYGDRTERGEVRVRPARVPGGRDGRRGVRRLDRDDHG